MNKFGIWESHFQEMLLLEENVYDFEGKFTIQKMSANLCILMEILTIFLGYSLCLLSTSEY